MINISPAILTDSEQTFISQLDTFRSKNTIHIDIVGEGIGAKPTLQTTHTLRLLDNYQFERIEFHIMKNDPQQDIIDIISHFKSKSSVIVVLCIDQFHIQKNLNFFKTPDTSSIVPVINTDVLLDAGFYSLFNEIQVMTVSAGQQGSEFKAEGLDLVDALRKGGYQGKITIDGGVNLKTADLVKGYKVNRVVVGSYFSDISNFNALYQSLYNKLNS